MSTQTTLYRFFNASGTLLYVGISEAGAMRWSSHRRGKGWWADVASVITEHYPDRPSAAEAEIAAIHTESPKYNIVHNRKKGLEVTVERGSEEWFFRSRTTHHQKNTDLVLYGELNCSSAIDDCPYDDGEDQLEFYVDYVRRNARDEWDADAVFIYWCVQGEGVSEAAPFMDFGEENFLTHYTWPENANGELIDWFKLPVKNLRFPKFAQALVWTPAPLQPTCPLRSIWASKMGQVV